MESVIEFSMKSHENTVKFTRKMVTGQMIWVGFNISLVCFDWFNFINSPSKLSAFSFGAMAVTALWSFIFLLQVLSEFKTEKHHLKFLTELRNTQMMSDERQQYLNAKKTYEQMIIQLKEKKDDTGIQHRIGS